MNDKENRIATDWTAIAKEPVTVNIISAVAYGFASELACLRLFHKYAAHGNPNGKFRCGYSVNRQSWYFSLEF